MTGEVHLKGRRLNLRHYQDCIAEGIVYLSEDRKADGVFLDMSIAANVSAMSLRQVSRCGIINRRLERQLAERAGRDLRPQVRPPRTTASRRCPVATSRRSPSRSCWRSTRR